MLQSEGGIDGNHKTWAIREYRMSCVPYLKSGKLTHERCDHDEPN